jgi:hypothetical protein
MCIVSANKNEIIIKKIYIKSNKSQQQQSAGQLDLTWYELGSRNNNNAMLPGMNRCKNK